MRASRCRRANTHSARRGMSDSPRRQTRPRNVRPIGETLAHPNRAILGTGLRALPVEAIVLVRQARTAPLHLLGRPAAQRLHAHSHKARRHPRHEVIHVPHVGDVEG